MKKNHLFLLLTLVFLTNTWEVRLLQGWADPNCSQWSDDGLTCKKCAWKSYYNSDQKKCIQIDDLCKTWSQTNGDCLTCFDSYGDAFYNGNAIDGKCPPYNGTYPGPRPPFEYDVNCQCYSNDKLCQVCYSGYSLDSNGKCQPGPAGCKVIQANVCVECLQGYFLDTQSDCNLLGANCTETDNNGVCTKCAEGFFLTPQATCTQPTQNCAIFFSSGECSQCNQGYYLDQMGNCNFLSPHCNATDNQGVCTECEQGYFLDQQNTCQLLPDNCFFTDNNGLCTQCAQGYYLTVDRECALLPANCLAADSNGLCTQCADGFSEINGVCNVAVGAGQLNPDCAQQNSKGQCTSCRKFYELSGGKCKPTGQNPSCKAGQCQCGTGECLECIQGYFLDNHGICTVIAQNCDQYSKQNGSCTTCLKDFVLTDGQCVPSVGNPVTNLNCKVQESNGTCTECRQYYKLQKGDCVPTGQNPKCHSWDSKKVCQCCYYHNRFYLDNNNICEQRNPLCAQFNPQNGQCTLCSSGDTLSNGECVTK